MNYTEKRPTVVMDTECYPNYWSIAFRQADGDTVTRLSLRPDSQLDRAGIARIFQKYRVVSFNGNGYDLPMIALAMSGASNRVLKKANDDIIIGKLKPWKFYEQYDVNLPDYIDHIDLMEVSPGSPQKPSLKLYAGRMHSEHMQDLPYKPDEALTPEQIFKLDEYHDNDLAVTADLYLELEKQLELRALMSEKYGLDLRSKSDAQIAEAVIRAEVERMQNRRLRSPGITVKQFKYKAPAWVKFETTVMREMLSRVLGVTFNVNCKGKVKMPVALKRFSIPIGDSAYRMGIGGLHSSEESIAHRSDDDFLLIDRDVTSYYPNIIMGLKLFPQHIGEDFLKIYRKIYERRIVANESNDKDTSETLKIVLNGAYGKLGSPYSVLYSPEAMIQTTITGQLAILMMIERAELSGFSVVSANTDGFVTRVERARKDMFDAIVFDWECDTGFQTKETRYKALYSRDVNNYVAITEDGKVKRKGAYAKSGRGQPGAAGLKKNPSSEIAIAATIEYLQNGVPVAEAIKSCDDVRQFVSVTRVEGGAYKNNMYIGKAVRWYYAIGETGFIANKSGDTVPRSLGAKPLMRLPNELPDDVDYDWYIREATAILNDVGLKVRDPAFIGKKGRTLARLPKLSSYHILDYATGKAVCGKTAASMRVPWITVKEMPDGGKLCSKCKKEYEL